MRQGKAPPGLEFLAGLIVVSALATGKTLHRLGLIVGKVAHAVGLFLFTLLKVCFVAALIFRRVIPAASGPIRAPFSEGDGL